MLKNLLCVSICFLSSVSSLEAGAWVRKPCEWFFSWEGHTYQTAQAWDTHGRRMGSNDKLKKWELSLYGEYGLTCCDTLAGQVRYVGVEDTMYGQASGIDEMTVAWKHKWWECGEHVISTQGELIIPGGHSGVHPSLRYGRWGWQSEFLWSFGFDWWRCKRGFFDFAGGYKNYFGYPSDQITGELRLGLDLFRCFSVIGWLQLDYGIFNGEVVREVEQGILSDANYRLLKGTLLGRYKINRCYELIFGYQKHLWGRKVGTGGGLYGSLWVLF